LTEAAPAAARAVAPPPDASGTPVNPDAAPAPLVDPNAALIAELVASLRQMNAPKRVVRDAHGPGRTYPCIDLYKICRLRRPPPRIE
jgi:hypothetical protein